jgi:translation elongation factor P/translation initiation factor 5A
MKIQAKDIKVGMTIVQGFQSLKVEKIEQSELKNGTPIVVVSGEYENRSKSITTGKLIVRKGYTSERIKYQTMVKIK